MRHLKSILGSFAIFIVTCSGGGAQEGRDTPPAAARQPVEVPALSEEFRRQQQIYRSKGVQVPEGYVLDRSLLAYASLLPPGFDRDLAALAPAERWLDVGAGQGQAILDYYGERFDAMHPQGRERRGKKAQAVAISIGDRRTPAWHKVAATLDKEQIQYFAGKPIRDYSRETLGRFQLVSDVFGGFSYTRYLSRSMETVLDLMTVNASFYTVLMDVHYEKGGNHPYYPGAAFRTEIVDADGKEMKICAWLKQIGCVEVVCDSKPDWTVPLELYQLRKVCEEVKVPPLQIVHFEAGTPPERRFKLLEAPTAR